jgi:hypothetical protein
MGEGAEEGGNVGVDNLFWQVLVLVLLLEGPSVGVQDGHEVSLLLLLLLLLVLCVGSF